LKPANVLLHHGVWKLADLGLARRGDSKTAANTLKQFMTPPFAAPEQWRGERPSKATDIYALGCIAYVLITAEPPFPGPEENDYAQQHQSNAPPLLPASPQLRTLVAACLSKNPGLRPGIEQVRGAFARLRQPAPPTSLNPLLQVAAEIA